MRSLLYVYFTESFYSFFLLEGKQCATKELLHFHLIYINLHQDKEKTMESRLLSKDEQQTD